MTTQNWENIFIKKQEIQRKRKLINIAKNQFTVLRNIECKRKDLSNFVHFPFLHLLRVHIHYTVLIFYRADISFLIDTFYSFIFSKLLLPTFLHGLDQRSSLEGLNTGVDSSVQSLQTAVFGFESVSPNRCRFVASSIL